MGNSVVKDIDKLGRLVLPKAMRESLGVRLGDSVNLVFDSDKIFISKYDHLSNLKYFADIICQSIFDISHNVCIVSNNEMIVSACGIDNIVGNRLFCENGELVIRDKRIKLSDIIVEDILKGEICIGAIIVINQNANHSEIKTAIKLFAYYLRKLIDG